VATFDSAWQIIARSHWDTALIASRWQRARDSLRPRAASATTNDELRAVLQQLLATLQQSHFAIFPREARDTTRQTTAAGDIGVTLRLIDSGLVIASVATTSPARGVMSPGWLVEAINGERVQPWITALPASVEPRQRALLAVGRASRALSGAVGTPVTLSVRDARDSVRTVTVTRVPFAGTRVVFGNLPPLHAQLEWERRTIPSDGDDPRGRARTIGIIRFNIWLPVLARAFDVAIDSLRASDAIVLDLRDNPGGVGGMAMGIAGHFVDDTVPVGVMITRAQTLRFAINPRRVNTAGERVIPFAAPLAILVDAHSVSTSEIFAAGLQELGRARIFGEQTAGQALPAVAEVLPNGDILYHAIANFTTPGGRTIEGPGVVPDASVPLRRAALLAGQDAALDAALQWAASASRGGGW
jgi:carboxyl-terminal processing protease